MFCKLGVLKKIANISRKKATMSESLFNKVKGPEAYDVMKKGL